MPNLLFSYENLNQKLIHENAIQIKDLETKYYARRGDDKFIGSSSFIFLGCNDNPGEETKEGDIASRYELKFHVSLPEWDREKYAQGWDIIKDIVIENRVSCSKIAHEEIRMSEGSGTQRGKDVTIYAKYHPDKDARFWLDIAEKITMKLRDNQIPPGYPTLETGSRRDFKLLGSNYISYRYERSDIPENNDIMRGLSINVSNQEAPRPFNNGTETEDIYASNTLAK